MTDEEIRILEERGFTRWQKGDKDRLYANAESIGLYCEYEKGKIVRAWLNDEPIDPNDALLYKVAKGWIDTASGKVYCQHKGLEALIVDALEDTRNEISEEIRFTKIGAERDDVSQAPPWMTKKRR